MGAFQMRMMVVWSVAKANQERFATEQYNSTIGFAAALDFLVVEIGT